MDGTLRQAQGEGLLPKDEGQNSLRSHRVVALSLTPVGGFAIFRARAEIAQSVEQRPEKPRVRSSILRLGTPSWGRHGSLDGQRRGRVDGLLGRWAHGGDDHKSQYHGRRDEKNVAHGDHCSTLSPNDGEVVIPIKMGIQGFFQRSSDAARLDG